MTTARPKREASKRPLSRADAVASLRQLRDKIVHVTLSDPSDRKPYAEFELPISDDLVSVMDKYLQAHPEPTVREPNARLAAALEDAMHIEPRFKSAQELFDALEKEGQG